MADAVRQAAPLSPATPGWIGAVVRRLVELHVGTIVASSEGEGPHSRRNVVRRDVGIIDISLPRMDDYQVGKRIIILSSRSNPDQVARLLSEGAEGS